MFSVINSSFSKSKIDWTKQLIQKRFKILSVSLSSGRISNEAGSSVRIKREVKNFFVLPNLSSLKKR